MLVFFTNLSLMEFQVRYLASFLLFFSSGSGWEVFTKNIQLISERVPPGSTLGPSLFPLYINDLPDDVICDIAIYFDDTTLYS